MLLKPWTIEENRQSLVSVHVLLGIGMGHKKCVDGDLWGSLDESIDGSIL